MDRWTENYREEENNLLAYNLRCFFIQFLKKSAPFMNWGHLIYYFVN